MVTLKEQIINCQKKLFEYNTKIQENEFIYTELLDKKMKCLKSLNKLYDKEARLLNKEK
jgi:hypothetical protein